MIATRMFLKDFITRRKTIKYIAILTLFSVFLKAFYTGGQNKPYQLSWNIGVTLGICVAFSSTLYVIYTYSNVDKIRLYISLPLSKSKIFAGYFFALFSCTILQRVSFIIIGMIFLGNSRWEDIILTVISSAVAILINIGFFLGKNRNNIGIIICNIIILAALLMIGSSSVPIYVQLILILFMGAISITTWKNCETTDLVIEHKVKGTIFDRAKISNYFARVVLTEKIYMTNTIMIYVFIVFFAIISKQNTLMLNLLWTIGAINTPFLTMLSGEPFIDKHIEMLPGKKNTIYVQYCIFLIGYFGVTNLIILFLNEVIASGNICFNMLYAMALVIIETAVVVYLEKQYRIKEWQTKQDLWKHPRKYILPIVVFGITLITRFIFDRLILSIS